MSFQALQRHRRFLLPSATISGVNPTGWWKFNDGSGTTVSDSSGNGYNGTLSGTPTWHTGYVTLNGQWANCGTSVPVYSNQITMMMWMQLASYSGNYPGIMGAGGVSSTYSGILFWVVPAGNIIFSIYSSTASVSITSPSSILSSLWTHFAGVIDIERKSMIFYINGAPVGNVDPSVILSWNSGYNFVFNSRFDGGYNNYASGLSLDDARVYNTAFTDDMISYIYNAGRI
jgi:hypothetical protein